MNYKKFNNEVFLSRLGMGNMRLPILENEPGKPIDYKKGQEIIDYCINQDINYFDTAYIYHDGESEVFTGKALAKYPRDSYYIADKYNLSANPDYKVQFDEQLNRLNMDYIDFYLLHGVSDDSAKEYLTNGCIEYFLELKKKGKIKYLGFSFHGKPSVLEEIASHHQWDFAQIQLNYYDWKYNTAKEQYEILTNKNIPIMVMEPVHGGMLASLTDEGNEMLRAIEPNKSIASWALRFVMGLENVYVILSGMSNMEQVQDNIATFNENKLLLEKEKDVLMNANSLLHKTVAVTCTLCRYCCSDCPQKLDIPSLLSLYNEAKLGGTWRLARLKAVEEDKRPSSCIRCGICKLHCPQSLDIPKFMKDMADNF